MDLIRLIVHATPPEFCGFQSLPSSAVAFPILVERRISTIPRYRPPISIIGKPGAAIITEDELSLPEAEISPIYEDGIPEIKQEECELNVTRQEYARLPHMIRTSWATTFVFLRTGMGSP